MIISRSANPFFFKAKSVCRPFFFPLKSQFLVFRNSSKRPRDMILPSVFRFLLGESQATLGGRCPVRRGSTHAREADTYRRCPVSTRPSRATHARQRIKRQAVARSTGAASRPTHPPDLLTVERPGKDLVLSRPVSLSSGARAARGHSITPSSVESPSPRPSCIWVVTCER
jgi:hypothetical protein